jgi:hypothetical protein
MGVLLSSKVVGMRDVAKSGAFVSGLGMMKRVSLLRRSPYYHDLFGTHVKRGKEAPGNLSGRGDGFSGLLGENKKKQTCPKGFKKRIFKIFRL